MSRWPEAFPLKTQEASEIADIIEKYSADMAQSKHLSQIMGIIS